jgi:putative CocE/NonD family hydrolase
MVLRLLKDALRIIIAATILTITANAQDEPDSVFIRKNYTKHEYRIPMRDGIKLFTSAYVPKDTTERHPILLQRSPYSAGPYGEDRYIRYMSNLSRQYWHRKYIIVVQDVRGRFMSEGTFMNVRPLIPEKKSVNDIDESSDAYDTVEWLVANIPGNNGRVGIKGISYPGGYSTMASIDAHPAVKATSPQAPVSEWMGGDDFFHNGALLISHAFDFFVGFGWPRPEPTKIDFRPFDPGTPDGYDFYMRLGALPNANIRYMHDSVEIWNDIMEHGTWDDFWKARSVLPHLKNIRPATLVVGGWYDTENLFGALHTYAEIEKNNPSNHNSLVIGPWCHTAWAANDLDSLGPIKYGSNLSKFFAEELEVPFFEYYLRDEGTLKIPEAAVFLTGANEWKMLDSWPQKDVEVKNLYITAGENLGYTPPSPNDREYTEYISDPAKPVPYTSEITGWYNPSFMVEDQRFASRRPDVVVFKTEILNENVTIAGPIKVHLSGSTTGTDCDWIVKVIDVFPDTMRTHETAPPGVQLGGYQMLVRGDILRGKFRDSLSAPKSIKPNTPTVFEYILQDIFHQFKAGHRIMVQIQSTWFPFADRNPGKFMDIYKAKDSDFEITVQRVYHSAEHQSYIALPQLR